jgi:hypothetical protein
MKGLFWTLVAVGVPALVVVAVLGLVGLVVLSGMVRWWLAMRRVQAAMAPPPLPPAVERWAAGAYGMWTGGEDCATWDPERARQSLQSWYGATDAASLGRTIDGLATGNATGNAAWDQVRAVDLVRIGMAAGYLSREQGQQRIRSLAKALRARHGSWEETCSAFEAGMHEWQDSRGITDEAARGRVQRNLPQLRAAIWPQIPYDAAL